MKKAKIIQVTFTEREISDILKSYIRDTDSSAPSPSQMVLKQVSKQNGFTFEYQEEA